MALLACSGSPQPSAINKTSRPEAARAAKERPSKPQQILLSYAIYTTMEGEAAARLVEPHGVIERLASSCDRPACRPVLDLLRTKEALSVTMALTSELPPPGFAFPAGTLAEGALAALESKKRVVIVGVRGPEGPPFVTLAGVTRAAQAIGTAVEGLVFDPDSLMLWQPEELPSVDPGAPLAGADQLGLGILPLDKTYRIVTFGMKKFQRPDLVAEEVPEAELPVVTSVLLAAALQLAERRDRNPLVLTEAEVRRAARPGAPLPEASAGAEGMLQITLGRAQRRGSDPDNELAMPEAEGKEARVDQYRRWRKQLFGG